MVLRRNNTSGEALHRGKKSQVPSLERGLKILEVVASSKHGWTLSEISRLVDLPKSSTHCLLSTLECLGYLQRNARTSRYMFGLKNLKIANEGLACIELREQALPSLWSLTQKTRLTTHLMVPAFQEAVVIGKIEPPGLLRLATWIGKRMDLHCTGGGKALLAYFAEPDVDRLVREYGLPRHNENTIGSSKRLKNELASIRKQGYSLDDEEDEIGVRCLAAPVFDSSGSTLASVSISGTIMQITADNLTGLVTDVRKAASNISGLLGFHD